MRLNAKTSKLPKAWVAGLCWVLFLLAGACNTADTITDNVKDATNSASKQIESAGKTVEKQSTELGKKVNRGTGKFIEEIKKDAP
jgi:hypothetical protein